MLLKELLRAFKTGFLGLIAKLMGGCRTFPPQKFGGQGAAPSAGGQTRPGSALLACSGGVGTSEAQFSQR